MTDLMMVIILNEKNGVPRDIFFFFFFYTKVCKKYFLKFNTNILSNLKSHLQLIVNECAYKN